MKTKNKIIAFSIYLGVFILIFNLFIDQIVFHGRSLTDLSFHEFSKAEIFIQSLILVSYIIFGLIASRLMAKREQVEKTLEESEGRLALALDATNDGIWDWDISNNKTYTSPRFKELLGFKKKDSELMLPFDAWASRIHPHDNDRVMHALQTNLDGKSPFNVEYLLRDKFGKYRWQNARGLTLFDENGKACRMVGSIRDIHDHKLAEEALQKAHGELELRVEERTTELKKANEKLQREINERTQAETALKLNTDRLEALLKLNEKKDASEKELTNFALEECVRLTQSKVGYLHFYNEDQKCLDLYLWSKQVLKECRAEKAPHYPIDEAGVWADCIRLRKPAIHNDYQNLPDKKGYPEGHFPVTRHMSIPVFDGNKIIAVAGVGNKEKDYDASDVRQLTLFMEGMWGILKHRRTEKIIAQREERLQRQNKALTTVAESKMVAQPDLKTAFAKITEAAVEGLMVQRAGIWLLNEDRSAMACLDLYDKGAGCHSEGIEFKIRDYQIYFDVLQKEGMISADDARMDPRAREKKDNCLAPMRITSTLDVSITVRGEIEGVISFEHVGPPREWKLDEESFARSMADFVALVIGANHRRRLEEDLRQRMAWAASLQKAGEELASCETIKQVAEVGVHAPVKHLGLKMAWISHPSDDGHMATVVCSDPDLEKLTANSECVHEVCKTRQSIFVPNAVEHPLFPDCRYKARKGGFRSCATFPIMVKDQCIATLSVRSKEAGPKASPIQAASLIEVFCRQLGYVWQRCLGEKELQLAREEAETANRTKSEFLAGMSHELRTPLNAIIGFSEVLQDKYFGPLTGKQEDYVNDILLSGRHLLAVINDILDLSKVEAGKMELELSGVSIKTVLESSMVMIKEKALKHGISLDLKVPASLSDIEIQVDERKIKQVIFNLLSNAVKFTPDGGAIKVEAKQEGKELRVSVSNTGMGIAPEDRQKIFEEFYQSRGALTAKAPGTGLGLPLARQFMQLHGGRLWVESEGEGKGSRFSFSLPLDLVSPEEPEREKEKRAHLTEIKSEEVLFMHLGRIISLYKKENRKFTLSRFYAEGQAIGEKIPVLVEVVEKNKRAYDLIVMGKSGSLFLILQDTDDEDAKAACERITQKADDMIEGLKVSCFIASFPKDAQTPDKLIEQVSRTTGERMQPKTGRL